MCYPFRQGNLETGRVVKLMDLEPKLWQESVCLIIPTISTKRTITSYHNSLNTKWGTTTNDVRNIGFALGQAQYYVGVKPVIENICEKLTWWPHLIKYWSQIFSVHEEITSIKLYTPFNPHSINIILNMLILY